MRAATFAIVLVLVIAASGAAFGRGHGNRDQENGSAGRFDYYLMSLSWSPSFCATHENETEQCGTHGFGFVLHGLWPQYRNGSWPQHCRTEASPDEATIARTLAFMPSRHLIDHEWQTHGSCTGLDPQAYFDLADKAFATVAVPPALRAPRAPPQLSARDLVDAFVAANPRLSRDMISVECHDGAELTEVHVCLSRGDLAPIACGGGMRNTCRVGTLRIAASR
jgi:ribonuclease T2